VLSPLTEATKLVTLGVGGAPHTHAQKLSKLSQSPRYLNLEVNRKHGLLQGLWHDHDRTLAAGAGAVVCASAGNTSASATVTLRLRLTLRIEGGMSSSRPDVNIVSVRVFQHVLGAPRFPC
jgi:hypothetical protein